MASRSFAVGAVAACTIAASIATSERLGPFPAKSLSDFVANGFLTLPPSASFDTAFHEDIFSRTLSCCQRFGHGGQTSPPKEPWAQVALWDNPNLSRVIVAPEVTQALEAILGPGYVVFPHRHMHTSSDGFAQHWHQDPSILPARTHRPRSVLVMYYPGEVGSEDGPTSFLPGSHYVGVDRDLEIQHDTSELIVGQYDEMMGVLKGQQSATSVEASIDESAASFKNTGAGTSMPPSPSFGTLRAGSVVINHYEIFHRGTLRQNATGFRPMYKWLVLRAADPPAMAKAPSFPASNYHGASDGQLAIWRSIWDWLHGARSEPIEDVDASAAESALRLEGRSAEMERLGGAYRLARAVRQGGKGSNAALEFLFAGLRGSQSARRGAMYGLAEAGRSAVPGLVRLVDSRIALPQNETALAIRSAATYALGEAVEKDVDRDTFSTVASVLFSQLSDTQDSLASHIRQRGLIFDASQNLKGKMADVAGQDVTVRAMRQLVWMTSFALGLVMQAAVESGMSTTFLPQIRMALLQSIELTSITNPMHHLSGNHAPFEQDLLTLAAVSAVTSPGRGLEAFITEGTPPFMYSDRFPLMFVALAQARFERVKCVEEEACSSNLEASGSLSDMAGDQVKLLKRPVGKRYPGGQRRTLGTPEVDWEDKYEARVFPALLKGDISPFYRLGASQDGILAQAAEARSVELAAVCDPARDVVNNNPLVGGSKKNGDKLAGDKTAYWLLKKALHKDGGDKNKAAGDKETYWAEKKAPDKKTIEKKGGGETSLDKIDGGSKASLTETKALHEKQRAEL